MLRAAVAEVEDYTRIMVISRTEAALAGSAVADLIHLIAELAENATIFSPPNTPVRILGDTVGKGFAVEIEDRGLGISDEPLADINRDLADPPQFDLSGSDRLGLFVAARLAARHDIKISLRPSVHGGTTAIVLIPLPLVTQPEPADSGLPGSAGRELPPRLARRRSALSSGCARVPLRHCRGRRQLPGRSGGGRADAGLIAYEMAVLVKRVGEHLTVRTRPVPSSAAAL